MIILNNPAMKAFEAGLWSIWVYGLLLIVLSLYSTQKLPSLKNHITKPKLHHRHLGSSVGPKITIFSAPSAFIGTIGDRQHLAIRSWLALSPSISVVLFSQDPSVVSFAAALNSQVFVESDIDFTFLGTPFFHSMVGRSISFASDIYVLADPETILLPDFITTLNQAYELDHDWLLFASSRKISKFPFHFDTSNRHWKREDRKFIKAQELQEMLGKNWKGNRCKEKVLLAWNNGDIPLHSGILPPFLYGRGVHNNWIISEAMASEYRFVFDASWTISSFYLNDPEPLTNQTLGDIENRGWEYFGNSHIGALYGSSFHHEVNYSSLVKLLKCDRQYILVDAAENIIFPSGNQSGVKSLWKRQLLRSLNDKNTLACVDRIKSLERVFDYSLKDQKMPSSSLNFPFSLESLLSIVADDSQTVVLAVAGYSYKDMLMNWVCRLRHLRITNFFISALDLETYQFSILQGLPVFQNPFTSSNISFDDCHFGTKCFQKVTKVKSRMVLRILKLGYNVLLSDVDVHWFKNPLQLLSSFGHGVLAAQSDEFNETGPVNLPRRLNSGFYFARSDGPTIAAMEKVVMHAATSDLSEQPSFYDTLCGEGGSNRVGEDKCTEPETNLTVHFLDRNLFPNGAYLGLWQKTNVKRACIEKGCFVLHNNWISGRLKKLERQVFSGLWEYDMSTRMCLFHK